MDNFARLLLVAGVLVATRETEAQARIDGSPAILERTTTAHPMHYFVSLPSGWSAERRWPVLIVLPDAFREFEATTREFAEARGSRPFLIVVPMVLSGGGTAQQHKTDFDYTDGAWKLADQGGNCRFDQDGFTAVLSDIRRLYNADSRVFVTGWEAGGHVAIAELFQHPERLRAVAIVTPNFIGRCVEPSIKRLTESEAAVPVRVFHGEDDPAWADGQPLFATWPRLDSAATKRGFRDVRDSVVSNAGHGPLAKEIMTYFGSLLSR